MNEWHGVPLALLRPSQRLSTMGGAMLTYKLLLSGKQRVEGKGLDASDAIQKALERFPGETVKEGYSGCKEYHTVHTPVGTYEAGPRRRDYQGPPHIPF